jgi:hypothetical protein
MDRGHGGDVVQSSIRLGQAILLGVAPGPFEPGQPQGEAADNDL